MKRIAAPLLMDVRAQFLAVVVVGLVGWSRLAPAKEPESPYWEVIFPPHPMMCEVDDCHACVVILAEYERKGTPLKP
jgi:hypothetical protein